LGNGWWTFDPFSFPFAAPLDGGLEEVCAGCPCPDAPPPTSTLLFGRDAAGLCRTFFAVGFAGLCATGLCAAGLCAAGLCAAGLCAEGLVWLGRSLLFFGRAIFAVVFVGFGGRFAALGSAPLAGSFFGTGFFKAGLCGAALCPPAPPPPTNTLFLVLPVMPGRRAGKNAGIGGTVSAPS
jgi:hypothetical protein